MENLLQFTKRDISFGVDATHLTMWSRSTKSLPACLCLILGTSFIYSVVYVFVRVCVCVCASPRVREMDEFLGQMDSTKRSICAVHLLEIPVQSMSLLGDEDKGNCTESKEDGQTTGQ